MAIGVCSSDISCVFDMLDSVLGSDTNLPQTSSMHLILIISEVWGHELSVLIR